MKKILLIGLCLLVATLGITAASAAEVNNNTASEVLSVEHNIENIDYGNIESIKEDMNKTIPNMGQKTCEALQQCGIKNPTPTSNMIKIPNPPSDVPVKYDNNNRPEKTTPTVNKNNDTNTHNPNNNKNTPVKVANMTKHDIKKEPTILKKSKTFNYKGDQVYLALIQNGTNKKLVCYKACSSGLSGAGSSYVSEVGCELLKIAEEQGVIKKMAYGVSWCAVKLTRFVVGLFTDDYKGVNDDFWINVLVYGDPISISDLW